MKHVRQIFLLLIIFILLFLEGTARITTIGIPAIQNFTRRTYHASTQNWAIAQDYRGFMYFANNDGVLEYDGTSWQLYQFVEPFLTRSLSAGHDGSLYIGMVNEFGVARPDTNGKLTFSSFRKNLPESVTDVGDVWRVHVTGRGIFFQSYTHLFLFDENGTLLRQYEPEREFRFSFLVNGKIYIQELERGLMILNGDRLELLPGPELLRESEIWALLPGKGDNLLIATSDQGVFSYNKGILTAWKTQANEILINNQIFSACIVQEEAFAFGTIHDGLLITNENGELIKHLNKDKGLQNNTVLSMSTDHTGNLWLGLDNGIDYVEVNSSISFLYQPGGFGTGYASAIHNGYLYLGTNNGLFSTPWPFDRPGETVKYELIPNTVGQVWYLGVHRGKLLCGHDNGAFEVNGTSVRKISDVKGAWKFIELPQYPDKMIGGTYLGLTVYRRNPRSGSWEFETVIPGFNESSRVMEVDRDGKVWMTHGFKGVYKIDLDLQANSVVKFDYYNDEHGFVTKNYINVYKIDGKVVFTAREGIFTYHEGKNRFERDTILEAMFETREHISYIRQDDKRNIWFVAGNKPGILRFREDGVYALVRSPYEIIHNQMVGGFELIYPYTEEHIFFGLENGFAHYSPGAVLPVKTPFRTYIRKIETPEMNYFAGEQPWDSLSNEREIPEIIYRQNSIRFSFTSPRYDGRKFVEYSYFLENFSEEWSAWSLSPTCEFNNLHEGVYTFSVKARDGLGQISMADQFTFRVLPPWYRSKLAWISYVVLAILFILFSLWLMLKRIEISARKERLRQLREYRAKEQIYQHDALIAEKEIISLRNEKLRSNMIHRDKELANQTMHLIQKNKFLWKLKEELKKVESTARDEGVKVKLGQQIKRIDKEIDDANQWEVFESAFDDVHEDFLKRLKEKFPELTPREMRLCAYLKMNISSKEISSLLNISIRGVEISRYRLRKKLGIDRDTNLIKFILEL